jgi:beta-lactamase regulating signal transducer with metallopeptidase domain
MYNQSEITIIWLIGSLIILLTVMVAGRMRRDKARVAIPAGADRFRSCHVSVASLQMGSTQKGSTNVQA